MVRLNLVVLRSENPLEIARWHFDIFGLEFAAESHNGGVLHYSAKLEDALLEIYPSRENPSKNTFGLALNKSDFEKIALRMNHKKLEENLILIKDIDENSIILSACE